eukprot:jgi/Chrpa1/23965/Chrysochromulina_OHIO_Genome00026917-RA
MATFSVTPTSAGFKPVLPRSPALAASARPALSLDPAVCVLASTGSMELASPGTFKGAFKDAEA